ncbi:hypothetical protein NC653_024201 [Populus alba x Populus x berolinensis]|uniref:Uncharacterized protein n=1 Tax=Populus alba x Populus x berolinensis TaxID=444605 RepID=A0AAD6M8A3_9ROSI|nr:hypothetical protein NC653_024201 [Populus alba x Populus x berolinensis]
MTVADIKIKLQIQNRKHTRKALLHTIKLLPTGNITLNYAKLPFKSPTR